MILDRRTALLGLGAVMAGGAGDAPITGDAGLVRPFTEERQLYLLPRQPPLALLYRHEGRRLAFIGVEHTTDPRSPTFALIRRTFDQIAPRAAIIEGFATLWGENPQSQVAATRKPRRRWTSYERGEAFFAIRLAVERRIPFWGGEPTDRELVERLLAAGHDRLDVFYAMMFGPLAQDVRSGVFKGPADRRFDAAFQRWAIQIARDFDAPKPPTDAASFRAWYAARIGIAVEDDPGWLSQGGPSGDGPAQKIGSQYNVLRDRHLFKLIIDRLNTHGDVVVVYGGSHLANLWDALQAALGRPSLL